MDLKDVWDEQYNNNIETALKDKNLFQLELDAIKLKIKEFLDSSSENIINILELGSGTGLLAEEIMNEFKNYNLEIYYTGIDFSLNAVKTANNRNIKNTTFIENDFLSFLEKDKKEYNIILTQRSIMAIMEEKEQNKMLDLIEKKTKNIGIFSECTEEGFNNLNELRKKLKLKDLEKVWHSRYLTKNQLDKYFINYNIEDFSSIYYLITRIIYPYFEEPKHNTVLADFAASLKQEGDYSFLKLITFYKTNK